MSKSRMSIKQQEAARRQATRRKLRLTLFVSVSAAILAIAIYLAVSPLRALRTPAPDAASRGDAQQVVITMAGFTPPALRADAGRPFTIRLVNPDSPYHTDGGGWHQFRIEALGIDARVAPRTDRVQAFPALAPGRYEFYCDVCCGGKENPTMRGILDVT